MKKSIFLIDDIVDNKPITLMHKRYDGLIQQLKHSKNKRNSLIWLDEIIELLYNDPSDLIEFIPASTFIREIGRGNLPVDKDVFYFISCYHNLNTFTVHDFLSIDPYTLDFLVEKNIPIIIDASQEMHSPENFIDTLSGNHYVVKSNPWYYKNVQKLKIHCVAGTYHPIIDNLEQNSEFNVSFHTFPGPFFMYNIKGSMFNKNLILNQENIINKIKRKKITDNTEIWRAFSRYPRLNRNLFQLKVEDDPVILNSGKYSRLMPSKNQFIAQMNNFGLTHLLSNMDYIKNNIDKLNEIKVIDILNFKHLEFIQDDNFMFFVSLETFYPRTFSAIENTNSFLTEKTAMSIFSGLPFITLGGQDLGNILKRYGFRDFDKLKFHSQPNIFDEVDHVISVIKEFCYMSTKEKINLYDSWKENLIYNFNRYINLDLKKSYLESIHRI